MHEIDWLLKGDTPGVELLARTRLLGEAPSSGRIKALQRRLNEYPPVARMLARLDDPIASRLYKKYQGGFWALIFLAEMQADRRSDSIRSLVDQVLSKQHPNGGFSPYGNPSLELVCLTANLLRSLVHFGYGESDQVRGGFRRLAERILPNGGVPCMVIDNYTLLNDCKMTLPQTLRAVAAAPAALSASEELTKLRHLLVRKMLQIGVYRYVRPESAHFRQKLVPLRPKGISQKRFTQGYRETHPLSSPELLPKAGWLRFGFPHSYNSDLLEAMLALSEAGAAHDPVMDEALDHIEKKRGEDGRWKMETSLNGKMLADVEKKGRPSKWITLQALIVLQHFGRIKI